MYYLLEFWNVIWDAMSLLTDIFFPYIRCNNTMQSAIWFSGQVEAKSSFFNGKAVWGAVFLAHFMVCYSNKLWLGPSHKTVLAIFPRNWILWGLDCWVYCTTTPYFTSSFQAYVQLIERFGWKSYTILYEDNQGLVRLQELLKSPTQSDVKIVVRQLPQDEDYR